LIQVKGLPLKPATAPLHALTAGAIGTMTLAVMTRATLGHTGRVLAAGAMTSAIYALVTAAALLRVAAPPAERVCTAYGSRRRRMDGDLRRVRDSLRPDVAFPCPVEHVRRDGDPERHEHP
jgi:hypothetical protein